MWILDKNKPICPQIYSIICIKIANGELKPNEKLLSVREVSVSAGVNPNTVQKAFENLQRDKIIYSVRSLGWFVSEDVSFAKDTVVRLVNERTKQYLFELKLFGLTPKDVQKLIQEAQQDE